MKDDCLRTLIHHTGITARDHPVPFGDLANLGNSIITANVSIATVKPHKLHLAFSSPDVAVHLAMLMVDTHVLEVPARSAATAAAAALPPHPTKLALKATVSPGSVVSLLVAKQYNILHIFPVQYFKPEIMQIIVA